MVEHGARQIPVDEAKESVNLLILFVRQNPELGSFEGSLLALEALIGKTKETPSNCKLNKCQYNYVPPPENSQECVACPQLKNPRWKPKGRKPRQS